MNFIRIILFLISIILLGCNKNDGSTVPTVNEPVLNVSSSIEGLKITITGNTGVQGGTITKLNIDWGDGSADSLIQFL